MTTHEPISKDVEDFEPTNAPALTTDEEEAFEFLCDLMAHARLDGLPDGMQVALMRVTFHGRPESCVVITGDPEDGEESYSIRPVALLVTDEMFAEMNPA